MQFIPTKYEKDLTITKNIIDEIRKTHIGVEDMSLFSILADIANLSVLFIGVNGTGKSKVSELIVELSKRNVHTPHGLTPAGLRFYKELLSDTSSTIIVEDLSRSGGEYMQVNTVSLLSGLCYTKRLEKHSHSVNIDINNCIISALIYAQPLILKTLVSVNEFDSDIKDKCLRFYQLKRPITPNPNQIKVNTEYKYLTLDRINTKLEDVHDKEIIENMRFEVSRARALEHSVALIKASAILNKRDKVTSADVWVIRRLTRNMRIENYMFTKKDLEGVRETDVNIIPLLTALMTYKINTVKSISQEYQLSESRTRQILTALGKWVMIKDNEIYKTEYCKKIIKEISS